MEQLPVLATIQVTFQDEEKKDVLCLTAPGMEQLCLPTSSNAYKDGPALEVECAGGTWSLATLECKQHMEGSAWITRYLNQPKEGEEGKVKPRYINGKTAKGNFALVRSMESVVDLGQYPPIFPVIERSKYDPKYKARFEGNYRRLSDFAPFLLVSKASARDLASRAQVDNYPTRSFRGNIVVDGQQLEPWAEETWSRLEISSGSSSSLFLHNIKPCPRCTVPCRDQTTGNFLFPEKLLLWKVLKATFPRKFHDPEWGSWAGAYMGVYMGHNGEIGEIHLGDEVKPLEINRWDAHLQRSTMQILLAGGAVMAISLLIPFVSKRYF